MPSGLPWFAKRIKHIAGRFRRALTWITRLPAPLLPRAAAPLHPRARRPGSRVAKLATPFSPLRPDPERPHAGLLRPFVGEGAGAHGGTDQPLVERRGCGSFVRGCCVEMVLLGLLVPALTVRTGHLAMPISLALVEGGELGGVRDREAHAPP